MNEPLHGLLIDPYQKRIHQIIVANNILAWHRLLDCDCLDVAHVGDHLGWPIDIWVNDEGLLLDPVPPLFQWHHYHNNLAGYGLVLSSNQEGDSISTNLTPDALFLVRFEQWEARIKPEDVFEQLSRIYPKTWGNFGLGAKS